MVDSPACHPPRAHSPAVRLRVRAAAARERRAAAFPARKVLREALYRAGPVGGCAARLDPVNPREERRGRAEAVQ